MSRDHRYVETNFHFLFCVADTLSTDGVDQQTINSYATTNGASKSLFKKLDLPNGVHTIKITVANAAAPNVCELDRFMYARRVRWDIGSH